MKSVFVLASLSCMTAFASLTTEPGSLSSTEANYDGNSLILKGQVVLDHGLGKMTAEEALLQKQEVGKEFPFSSIQLKKDVKLALHQSAQIVCDSALLDFNTLKGTLLPSENQKVVYTDLIQRKKGDPLPFQLVSNSLELSFCRRPVSDKKTEYDVETLLAQDEVAIDYLNQFQLFADKALYRKELEMTNKTSRKEFQGIITAYPKNEETPCRLIHQGKEIASDMIDIDLVHSKLSLLHPRGSLATSLTPDATALRFKSDYLYWDHGKQVLTLKGQIAIEEDSVGMLSTQDELQLTLGAAENKSTLNKIVTQGLSVLTYQDTNHYSHRLTSHGSIQINREEQRAVIESSEKEGGQLCYEGDTFTIFSDSASIDYAFSGDRLTPSLITLKGNVRFSSRDATQQSRMGCADRLSYSVMTRTFILAANPGKKVLFWDDAQSVRLSAPEVHITTDPTTGEQQIKGVGAVQFAFTSDEQNKLQQLFPELKKTL